jgi:hypothetical protein
MSLNVIRSEQGVACEPASTFNCVVTQASMQPLAMVLCPAWLKLIPMSRHVRIISVNVHTYC